METIKVSTALDLIKNDNQIGFELLYKHHYRLLFSTAISVTKNEEDSKDVIQNVSYKLAKMKKESFPSTGEVSWLYRVVRNEALNYVKTKKTYENIHEFKDLTADDQRLNELFDMDDYYSLIESLNETQKEVVTLKVLGEFSHKEIAQLLNKPIGTVQWIYNTSIKKLRMTLTAMTSLIILLSAISTMRIATIYHLIIQQIPSHGDTPSSDYLMGSPSVNEDISLMNEILNDHFIMGCLGILIIISILLINLFIFSDKIPTKQLRKLV